MSLELAPRQRAMLKEMGVKVWWPALEVAAPEVLAVTRPATVTQGTPEFIAATTLNISLKASFDAENSVKTALHVPTVHPPAPTVAQRPPAPLVSTALPLASHLDWPALQDAVANCQACGLCETRKNTVFGVGQAPTAPALAPQVDWLIVGEPPDDSEESQGEPFTGDAGHLLDNMLKALKLNRQHQTYITHVMKCRTPHNRNPTATELAQCAPYLQRQIELLRPKVILALGRFSVQALLADSVPNFHTIPTGKLRGQVYAYHGVPVVVSYHPLTLLRNVSLKANAWADLCLAQSVVQKSK